MAEVEASALFRNTGANNATLPADRAAPHRPGSVCSPLLRNIALGFVAAVWLLLAQAASRVRALYFCSNCGEAYARPAHVRAPKRGNNNFCGDCRQGDRNTASKKLYAARRRHAQA